MVILLAVGGDFAVGIRAINVVLRSTSGWETKGLWLVILIFVPLLA